MKRLKSRGDNKNSWPARQIDKCLCSLSQDMFKKHIHTDTLTPEGIINRIASECNIDLRPDNRGIVKKKIDRLITQLKHIRF